MVALSQSLTLKDSTDNRPSLQSLISVQKSTLCLGRDAVAIFDSRPTLREECIWMQGCAIWSKSGCQFFQLSRLAMCGDICPNPGPSVRSKSTPKPKCNSCGRMIASNHRFMSCQTCELLYHMKCGGLKPREYQQLKTSNNDHGFVWCVCFKSSLKI